MPRPLRRYSNSKVYHIILKGIDNQDIFYEDSDRRIFLKNILSSKENFYYEIFAYCLMTNHVHMIVRAENEMLSKAMQSLVVRYSHYFNKKYKRTGPFLQNRFKSKTVENQRYFLDVCKYVHKNPEKAGISRVKDYEWSSYKEYIGNEIIINKKILLYYFNNKIEEFIKFTTEIDEANEVNNWAEFEIIEKLTDIQLANIIIKKFSIDSIENIALFFKEKTKKEQEKYIREIKNILGTNKTQVARVIRVGRKRIQDIWDKY